MTTLRGFQSDRFDRPQVDTEWEFTADGNDDTFDLLLGRRNLLCYLRGSACPHIRCYQRGAPHDLLKRLT